MLHGDEEKLLESLILSKASTYFIFFMDNVAQDPML